MFKLDLIRKLSRPVADNVVSKSVADSVIANLVANGLVYGGALLLSWLAARSAQVQGWPLYRVIILATALFLFIALTINLIDLVIVRHRRLARESKQENHETVSPALDPDVPNLVALDPKQVLVGEDDMLFECEIKHSSLSGSAVVAVIRNQGGAGRVALAQNVRAHIEYSPLGNARKHSVDNGVWLNTKEIFRDFPVGHTEKLVLAVEKLLQKEVFAYENNYISTMGERHNTRLGHKLLEDTYIVTVQLVGGSHGEIGNKFDFRLATQPKLSIEKLETTDSHADQAASRQSATPYNGWLSGIANDDLVSIEKAVKVCEIKRSSHFKSGSAQYLEFSFLIFNSSVFDVTLDDDVTGYITFHGKQFHHPIQMKENHVKDLSIRSVASYVLHQPVTENEAALIENADENWLFWFTKLNLTIKGGSRFPNVRPRLLPLNKSIRKGDLHWTASFYDIME